MIGTVIDIETTGWLKFEDKNGWSTLSDKSEILEVGYININMDTRKILTYGTLYFYKDYFDVESDAQAVHGLQREFLEQYKDDFDRNLIALNAMVQNTCIIGKNSNKFDLPFIKAFIEKHGGDALNFELLASTLRMKSYNGGTVQYRNDFYALDMQEVYKPIFRDRYKDKYSIGLGYGVVFADAIAKLKENNPDLWDEVNETIWLEKHTAYTQTGQMVPIYPDPSHQPLSPQKRGTLTDYINLIPCGLEAVDIVYNGLDKDRVTGAHGALYDAVMTYVVWCDYMNRRHLYE